MYDVSAQANYASAGYDEFDENVHPYDTSMGSPPQTPFTSSSEGIQIMTSSSRGSLSANSIVCGIGGLSVENRSISSGDFPPADSKSAQVFYGEYQFQSQMDRQKRKGVKKVGNKLLQDVPRKIAVGDEWDLSLPASTKSLNCHQIRHLGLSPQDILLGPGTPVLAIESKLLTSPNNESAEDIIAALNDPKTQGEVIRKYLLHRAETHDSIRAKSDARKEKEMTRYDREIARTVHEIDSLAMIYQKDTKKLQPR